MLCAPLTAPSRLISRPQKNEEIIKNNKENKNGLQLKVRTITTTPKANLRNEKEVKIGQGL
jgi:hypothetical protein